MSADNDKRIWISYREIDDRVYVVRTSRLKAIFLKLPEYQEHPDVWAALHFLVITPEAVDNT